MTHALDLAIDRFPAALSPERLLATPEGEVHLALRPEPATRSAWQDPGLGALYLVTNEANALVRLGRTARLRKRFNSLKIDSPVRLDLAHFVHVAGLKVAHLIDDDVQTRFLAHRRHGDWFDVPLVDAAQEMADAVYRRRLRFWSEAERREVGAAAGRCYGHMARR